MPGKCWGNIWKYCFPKFPPCFPPAGVVFSTEMHSTWSQLNVGSGFLENDLWKVKWQAFSAGVGPEHKKWCVSKILFFSTGNSVVNFKRFAVFEEFSSFSCSGPTSYTKMLVISLSINRFPKIRILRWAEITYYTFPSRKRGCGGWGTLWGRQRGDHHD